MRALFGYFIIIQILVDLLGFDISCCPPPLLSLRRPLLRLPTSRRIRVIFQLNRDRRIETNYSAVPFDVAIVPFALRCWCRDRKFALGALRSILPQSTQLGV